jgi:hypothetical protein
MFDDGRGAFGESLPFGLKHDATEEVVVAIIQTVIGK